jgi:iron complex outermembrane receptor protein
MSEVFPANVRGPASTLLNPAFASGCLPPVAIAIPGTRNCQHDTLAVVNLIPLIERANVLGGATWQLDVDNQLFAQYLYANDRYVVIRNQAPSSERFNGGRALVYPAGGPFYPTEFATANGLTGNLTLLYRAVPLGPITDDLRATAQHAAVGAKGSLWGWKYDAAWIYSENTERYFAASGRVSASRLIAAMASGLVNPFGPSGPEGDALLASAEARGSVFHNQSSTTSLEIKATTEIYRLPAGPLALALGAEARRERLGIDYAPEQTSGDIIGSIIVKSSSGHRSLEALFGELNVPIGNALEAQLAARYDRYSDFGGTTNPKVALRWQPMRSLLFRSSYGTGFRAPTIPDLRTPLASNFTRSRYDDPLRCPVTHSTFDCNTSFPIRSGGNPELEAERSEQFNFGFVWEPYNSLSIGADYWKIDKSRQIGALTADTLFRNFEQFAGADFIRGPADAAYPTLPGAIQYLFAPLQNLGNLRTTGVDVDLAYRSTATEAGRFGIRLSGTYIARWQQQLDGINYTSGVGRNAVQQAIPRWRHHLALDWNHGPWGATLAQDFSSGYIDENLDGFGNERRVGTGDVWDAQAVYTGFTNTTVTFGIKNVFDRAPPFTNQSTSGPVMYDPRYADPRGRLFYAKLTLAFK